MEERRPNQRRLAKLGILRIGAVGLLVLAIACFGDPPTVSEGPVAWVLVRPATASLTAGDTLRLAATLLDAEGEKVSAPTVQWLSSDAQVARVDQTGLVTATRDGSATIIATSDGIDGTASVSVRMASQAVGFIGYPDTDFKLTICGDCHVDEHITWVKSDHAGAWVTLQDSGRSQQFCEGCHSVTERGNQREGVVGHELDAGGRFHDVQCEACHGPGLAHLADPEGAIPHAALSAGGRLTTGCGECHRGPERPHVEQWEQSDMSRLPNAPIAAATDRACLACHEGRAALLSRFGESTRYVEADDEALVPIVCAVCHDPHGSDLPHDLRAQVSQPSSDHLCLRCHGSSEMPPSPSGPHAAQGQLLLGNAGWVPPGYEDQVAANRTLTTHGPERNPRLCLTCHMPKFTVASGTNASAYRSVGHTFNAITCLDSSGIPIPGPCVDEERYFQACVNSGCHGSAFFAREGDYLPNRARLNALLDSLWFDTDGDAVIDATDAGLLPLVVARGDTAQLLLTDDSVTLPEGALWNAQLAFTADRTYFGDGEVFGQRFWAGKSSGDGVHNPFLLETLLTVSVTALRSHLEEAR